ncbi:MAG: hypothetical protein JXB35_01440 [Anaerolineae bacterium]|nr:hypothetical protein [Anaerolineae bacterium]
MNLKRNARIRYLTMLLMLVGVLFVAQPVSADVGPKPTMTFELDYEVTGITIIEAQLLECSDAACTESHPLEPVGPQHFTCPEGRPEMCTSMAYGYADYHRLVIEFSDRVRESQVFKSQGFDETFRVAIREAGLEVASIRRSQGGQFGLAGQVLRFAALFVLTLGLEALVALLFCSWRKRPRSIILVTLLGNLLTFPSVWLLFPLLPLSSITTLILAELFAVVVEAAILTLAPYTFRPPQRLPFGEAVLLSILMNVVSFLSGLAF